MKNNLSLNSEVSDLLVNIDFLRLVRTFINIYWLNELIIDDKSSDFFDKLNTFQYKNEELEKIFSKSELLDELGFLFSHEEILSSFLEYIKDIIIDKKVLYIYLEIADYLINIYNNKWTYPENIDIESVRLKDKVWDILWKWKLDNISLLITKNNFPTIWKKWFPIIKIDFDNVVDFYWDGDKNFLFAKVEDTEWNIFYHNYKGDIFLTNDWREIIDVEYIYSFQEYSVLKVKTNDLQNSLEIRSKDWKTFDMPEWLWDILPWKLIDWEKELEYLILSKIIDWVTKTTLFNIDWDTVNLMDILRFINKWKESTVKMLESLLSKFEDIDVSSIKWIKTIGWVKFVELSLDLDNDDPDVPWEPELYNIIMMESWKPLTDDNWEYIRYLFEIESFWWKELLWFGFTPFSIDGFIDSTWNVLTINDELIHTIDDTRMKFRWEEIFKINNDENFVVYESKVKKALDKLLWFNEIELKEDENWFSLIFEDKDNFLIKNKKIDQLSCSIENWKLNILLYSNWVWESIEYRDLISELKEEKRYLPILKQINILINT